MKTTIESTLIKTQKTETLKYFPVGKCPMCHTSFDGSSLSAHHSKAYRDDGSEISDCIVLYVTHFCHACNEVFLAAYYGRYSYSDFKNFYAVPRRHIDESFSESIKKLSPSFVSTYNDALEAEQQNLFSICGLGYRKALEYLIKDYLIFRHPEEKEEILNTFLGNLINNKLDNERIKILASRSAWLGNDEAHYLKLHEGYDVQDLKQFINAMVTFFDAELSVDKALGITPKK